MIFTAPLLHGRLIRRYKRFLADVELNHPIPGLEAGTSAHIITAHCPNSGSMKGLDTPGNPVVVSRSDKPGRKLAYTLELVQVAGKWVGINTSRSNHIVHEALVAMQGNGLPESESVPAPAAPALETQSAIPQLAGYSSIVTEKKYGVNSRIDILLEDPNLGKCYVEVKNVTMAKGETAMFPDAVTARGTKHLHELMQMVAEGHRAVMFYLVQREDCRHFMPAAHIDPVYAATLAQARSAGVETICYSCNISPDGIWVARPIPITMTE